jgi:thiol-disulfide isomerase/thioredoxin
MAVIIFSYAQTAGKFNNDERYISIKYTPLKNTKIYLGSYFGKGKMLSDSTWLNDKSEGVFKGKKLTGGIYFIVSAQYVIQFQLLIGDQQHFSIVADTADKNDVKITGSPDNDIFKEYSKTTAEKGKALEALSKELSQAKTKKDSADIQAQLKNENKALNDYRENMIKKYPSSLLATLLNTMKQPELPANADVEMKKDSLFAFKYTKQHYWDDVNFYDDRILHTPFFEPKLDEYFKYYVSPNADSIISEINYILLSARTGKEIYPYLLLKFTNKYFTPEYMGQDKVFLFLFENFYSKGDTVYLSPPSRKQVFDKAYSIMANQLGSPAPVLNLTDTSGNKILMQALQSKFTVLAFWDPICSHCQKEIPRLDSFYRAKWKNEDVKIYSVNVNDTAFNKFKKFIKEKNLSSDWTQVYQPHAEMQEDIAAKKANFRQLYNIFITPTFYLLDADKNIIAKQLSIDQIDGLINVKLRAAKK